MNVWLLGASGFVGRHVAQALRDAGHTLVSRPRVDMARVTVAADWLPYLSGVDAAVNTVGVLRDSRRCPIWPTHASGPQALFDACAQAGVRRVVQVSALGIEGNPTAYARSKRAADEHLLALAGSRGAGGGGAASEHRGGRGRCVERAVPRAGAAALAAAAGACGAAGWRSR